jgi:hypothetical protein
MNYIDTQDLNNYSIKAQDGEIGKVSDFYFDEDLFYLRYLVVNTEPFLIRNLVLLSPISFLKINSNKKIVEVSMSKNELENSPKLDSAEVISCQYEKAYNEYFSWPYYGVSAYGGYGGYGASSGMITPFGIPWGQYEQLGRTPYNNENKKDIIKEAQENNLRSSREIRSYSVTGSDKEFGHIQGFILDPKTLSIDFIIIDTINYLPSKNVLLRPEWIKDISWHSKTVTFPFSQELIKSAPAYKKGEIDEKIIKISDEHFSGEIEEGHTKSETNKRVRLSSIRSRREDLKELPVVSHC